jgi:hypothetical protein
LASGAFNAIGVGEEIKLDLDPCLELLELEKIIQYEIFPVLVNTFVLT